MNPAVLTSAFDMVEMNEYQPVNSLPRTMEIAWKLGETFRVPAAARTLIGATDLCIAATALAQWSRTTGSGTRRELLQPAAAQDHDEYAG